MPAKTTTIATAEKRVILAEIATLNHAARKAASDVARERKACAAESEKLARRIARLDKSEASITKQINRRLAILEGRL